MIRTPAAALALSLLAVPAFAQTAPAPGAPAADAAAPAAAFAQTAPAPGSPAADAAAPAAEAPEAAIAGTYAFDPHHSQIVFAYDHMGFSTSRGMVNGVTGSVTLDPADPAKSKVEASFPLSALRTIAASLDSHLLSQKDFFGGAAPHTAVTFVSTKVESTGARTATVTGDLTLNGQTRPVTLDVTLNAAKDHPMTGRPAVGFGATGTIKRSDFGLGAFAPAVSDEVRIEIAVEALKG